MTLYILYHTILPLFILLHAFSHPLNPNDPAKEPETHWLSIWTTMPQLTEPANLPPPPFNTTPILHNTTLRQTLRATLPASTIRLRLSNAFGLSDLPITKVSISKPPSNKLGSDTILPETTQKIFFNGKEDIIIPVGGLVVSDPVDLDIEVQETVSVDVYLEEGQMGEALTSHPGSRTTSWLARGDWVGSEEFGEGVEVGGVDHWYLISAIEALLPTHTSSCAIIGDSITDGRGSDTNGNNRWPDLLLPHLQSHPHTNTLSLLNQAAGGNRLLHDGLGSSATSRLDRDVLAQPGIRCAVVFIGVNDIGTADPDPKTQGIIGERLITGYQQMITRLHASGLRVLGSTITPLGAEGGLYWDEERERMRGLVNGWIREGGGFDAVVDFDKVVRDPKRQEKLKGEFDSGDGLHLNVHGYQAMADAVPVDVLGRLCSV